MIVTILLWTGASITASLFLVQVALFPLVFKYNKTLQRRMVFSTCINYPSNVDYDDPSCCKVVGGKNFRVQFLSKVDDRPVAIGIWYMAPMSKLSFLNLNDNLLLKEIQNAKDPVILYCHGNSNHRASPHRLALYRVFQNLNYHVIAFDYRGYGDSTSVVPTEQGVVEDTFHVYAWLMNCLEGNSVARIVLWGHSLGSAVASHMVSRLAELCSISEKPQLPLPHAIVLESSFNNMQDEIERHPFSKVVSWLPYFKKTFVKPMSTYKFKTDEYLRSVPNIPVLILHTVGDRIVPIELAEKLFTTITESRKDQPNGAPVKFHQFPRRSCLGHNNLCDAEELPDVIKEFMELCQSWTPSGTSMQGENIEDEL